MSPPRIIAGKLKGRRLLVPHGDTVRPTSERMREALFNILEHGEPGLSGAAFLDLFAGSGAVGLEALSRGAAHVLMVENDHAVVRIAKDNTERLAGDEDAQVLRADARRLSMSRQQYDIVFMDPPYRSGFCAPTLANLARRGWLAPDGLVVAELQAREPLELPPGFAIEDERRYGAGRLVFLRGTGTEEA